MLDSPASSNGAASGRKVVLCGDVEARVFLRPHTDSTAGEGSVFCSGSVDGKASSEDDERSEGGVAVAVREVGRRSEGELTPQQLGRRRAADREKVRQAARRGVVFGFAVGDAGGGEGEGRLVGSSSGEEVRQCRRVEAVQGGRVVEASFAKGEWGVRWRDG